MTKIVEIKKANDTFRIEMEYNKEKRNGNKGNIRRL